MTKRAGSSLLEVQVALPLIALLGMVAVSILIQMYRVAISSDGRLSANRELRQGATVFASELRPLRARDVTAWNDTMIEVQGLIGVGIVCAVNATRDRLSVIDASGTVATQTDNSVRDDLWRQPPQAGDRAELWRDADARDDLTRAVTRTVTATGIAAACPFASQPETRATTALTLDHAVVEQISVGAPIRVTRPTRFSLYKASDGFWYLGRRTLSGGSWDVIQPVVGPLLAPRDRGLTLAVYDSVGAALAPLDHRASVQTIRVRMRAPHVAGRLVAPSPRVDSISIDIALRGNNHDGAPSP